MTEASNISSTLIFGGIAAVIFGILAFAGTSADIVHHAYASYFFDKVTFLVGCL